MQSQRLQSSEIQPNGLSRREERIFHFFERIGYTSFSKVCEEAMKTNPQMSIQDALEALFLSRKAEVKASENARRSLGPTGESEITTAIMSLQYIP